MKKQCVILTILTVCVAPIGAADVVRRRPNRQQTKLGEDGLLRAYLQRMEGALSTISKIPALHDLAHDKNVLAAYEDLKIDSEKKVLTEVEHNNKKRIYEYVIGNIEKTICDARDLEVIKKKLEPYGKILVSGSIGLKSCEPVFTRKLWREDGPQCIIDRYAQLEGILTTNDCSGIEPGYENHMPGDIREIPRAHLKKLGTVYLERFPTWIKKSDDSYFNLIRSAAQRIYKKGPAPCKLIIEWHPYCAAVRTDLCEGLNAKNPFSGFYHEPSLHCFIKNLADYVRNARDLPGVSSEHRSTYICANASDEVQKNLLDFFAEKIGCARKALEERIAIETEIGAILSCEGASVISLPKDPAEDIVSFNEALKKHGFIAAGMHRVLTFERAKDCPPDLCITEISSCRSGKVGDDTVQWHHFANAEFGQRTFLYLFKAHLMIQCNKELAQQQLRDLGFTNVTFRIGTGLNGRENVALVEAVKE